MNIGDVVFFGVLLGSCFGAGSNRGDDDFGVGESGIKNGHRTRVSKETGGAC